MEKYSKWRDAATGVQPFTYPLPASTDSAPPVVQLVALPLAWLLGLLRTTLVVLLLVVHTLLVEVLFAPLAIIPPLHAILARAATAALARLILFFLGFAWIPSETVSLKRTARSPPAVPFSPGQGDLLIANSSSYIDMLYLAFRYNPTFLLPVSSTGTSDPPKITSWRRVGLLSALMAAGRLPERSERGETLDEALKTAKGCCAVFPECTTSNNRAVLRAAELLAPPSASKPRPVKVFVLSFKYSLPTRVAPSATLPIPPSLPLPLIHIFKITSTVFPSTLAIRRLHPSESPRLSSFPRKDEWDSVVEALANTGKWKRVGLSWVDKAAFLEFRKKRKV